MPVCTGTYWVHTFLLIPVLTFLHFERLHTWYMLTLAEYVRLVPDSIARPPGCPAGLLASDSGTGPRIEPNHTRTLADLFTVAWQHPCQCLSAWERALTAWWGIQLWRVSFTRFAAAMISYLLTSSTSLSPQRSARCELVCESLGLQVGASMMSCKLFKQSCQVQVQRFYQRDKTKRWFHLNLSSADDDWDVDLEQWLEYQGYYCEIFKQSCKVQRFNQRDKTKSWSGLKLSSAGGDGDFDHELRLECCRCYC
jgi:hypothetical protein